MEDELLMVPRVYSKMKLNDHIPIRASVVNCTQRAQLTLQKPNDMRRKAHSVSRHEDEVKSIRQSLVR